MAQKRKRGKKYPPKFIKNLEVLLPLIISIILLMCQFGIGLKQLLETGDIEETMRETIG